MIHYVVILRVPPEGVGELQAYEAAVLPLLVDYGATLERRLRTADGTTEIHVLAVPSAAALDAYAADPRRTAPRELFVRSGATAELLPVVDV